jgi:hypothetical protein
MPFLANRIAYNDVNWFFSRSALAWQDWRNSVLTAAFKLNPSRVRLLIRVVA